MSLYSRVRASCCIFPRVSGRLCFRCCPPTTKLCIYNYFRERERGIGWCGRGLVRILPSLSLYIVCVVRRLGHRQSAGNMGKLRGGDQVGRRRSSSSSGGIESVRAVAVWSLVRRSGPERDLDRGISLPLSISTIQFTCNKSVVD